MHFSTMWNDYEPIVKLYAFTLLRRIHAKNLRPEYSQAYE